MSHSVQITTPFPTAKQVAKRLKLTSSEWKLIDELVTTQTAKGNGQPHPKTASTKRKAGASSS
jgi:hypothetical protein